MEEPSGLVGSAQRSIQKGAVVIRVDNRIVGMWSVFFGDSDWLAALKQKKDGTYWFICRFRYYKDDKVFGSVDEKNWYKVSFETREEALREVRYIYRTFTTKLGVPGNNWELMRKPSESLDHYTLRWRRKSNVHSPH